MTIAAFGGHIPLMSLFRRPMFLRQVCVGTMPFLSIAANSSTCQAVVLRRFNHSMKNSGKSNNVEDTELMQTDTSTRPKQNMAHEKRKVDPFAKRPSQKCDPYGLAGQSLSQKDCLEWLVTLESGWKLVGKDNEKRLENEDQEPIFLQKQFYHSTLHDASQFLSHISLLSTNLNHYPFLSMERVLVDDLSSISNHATTRTDSQATSPSASISEQRRRKVKGWVFVSTIRCSTYRPPTIRAEDKEETCDSSQYKDKGLTYHDFHLAMNIDIESNREGCTALLL